jgi:predicted dehydrogenase
VVVVTTQPAGRLGIGVIGAGWMGHVHARAYLRVPHHFPDLELAAIPVAVADPVDAHRDDAVRRYGFATGYTDWRQLITDPRVEAVSVTAPNAMHRELGVAVARAGKHLWIEKPVGLGVEDAAAVAAAVAEAGVVDVVGFNYRGAPAVSAAARLLADGAIGTVTHARFWLLTDYAAHPQGVLSWRFERDRGGNGVLGDLASHGVDLVRYLLGDVDRLVSQTEVFVPRRPLQTADGAGGHYALGSGDDLGPVENEDYLVCLLRTVAGVPVVLEASRVSVGDQNSYGFEIHGTRGQLRWDFRRMAELGLCRGGDYENQPVATLNTGPGDGDYAAFQPGAGIALGYDDLKVIEAAGFLRAVAAARNGYPDPGAATRATLADAVHSALALEAMTRSAATSTWVRLSAPQWPVGSSRT